MDFLGAVLAGVTIFVIGQIIIKFLIEPLYELRSLTGRIAHALAYYINATDHQSLRAAATGLEAMQAYRSLSAELTQRQYGVPLYRIWARVFRWALIPPNDLRESARLLIGLSNSSVSQESRYDYAEQVRKLLRIPDR